MIRRTIKRDGNKSSFTINGKPVSRSVALKFSQSFAIQVDNLCQFLPQDKVAEFAALTPIELLHSTQRAAAGPEMIEWHDGLKRLRAEQKRLEIENRADKEVLANLENRQEMQRADVERMRQRAEIKRKIEIFEFLRPIVEYKDFHKTYEALKATKVEFQRQYDALKSDLEPALQAVTGKKHYIDQLELVREHRKHLVDQAAERASERGKKIENFENSINDLNLQIEAERKSGQKHKSEATSVQQTLSRLRRQLDEEAVEFEPDYFNEKLVRCIAGKKQPLKASFCADTRPREKNDSRSGNSRPRLEKYRIGGVRWLKKSKDFSAISSKPSVC